MEPTWQTDDGRVRLFLGDCREVLPCLSGIDAVVTDPPYGIGYERGQGGHTGDAASARKPQWGKVKGDDKPFNPTPWLDWPCIMWGANHYAAQLPHGRWLAWNKLGSFESYDDFSDVEFAWQNKRAADKVFNYLWKGVRQAGEKGEKRYHPTQKPIALMQWCLNFLPDAEAILDPYMGSGTTGIACIRENRHFIGIESDPQHFETAKARIKKELSRHPLLAG